MLNVLLVDDEQDNHLLFRLKLKKHLADQEYSLYSFESGQECLDFVSKNPEIKIDLLLSDINMPHMDGFELIQSLKKIRPIDKIYMVSAYESQDHFDRATNLGASRYFPKPVDFQALVTAIREDVLK